MTSVSDISYLLFVIPGFVFVWTYRHFTNQKDIGDFEYAGWSFVWGTIIFLGFGAYISLMGQELPSVPLNDPAAFLGSLLGTGLVFALAGSLPLGLMAAAVSKTGLFRMIDDQLKKLLEWIAALYK